MKTKAHHHRSSLFDLILTQGSRTWGYLRSYPHPYRPNHETPRQRANYIRRVDHTDRPV